MTEKQMINKSRFLSMLLRHKPETIGLKLDENGWASTNELLEKLKTTKHAMNLDELKEIVEKDEKQRYLFSENHSKIRASQGHSLNIDLKLKEAIPPDILFHGTATKNLNSITKQGLVKMNRQYVHLSNDEHTAKKVGQRHGIPFILKINAKEMNEAGFKFFLSENNVWLCNEVPIKYIIF